MSQSLLYHAFGVREGYDYQETIYQGGCIRFVLSVKPDWIVCPACDGKDVIRKGRRFRELQTVPIGLKPVFLVTEVPKTIHVGAETRTISQSLPFFACFLCHR
jgi:transposase